MSKLFDDLDTGELPEGMRLSDLIPPNEDDGTTADSGAGNKLSVDDFMAAFEDDTVQQLKDRRRALIGIEAKKVDEFHAAANEFRARGVDDFVIGVAAEACGNDIAKFRAIVHELEGHQG